MGKYNLKGEGRVLDREGLIAYYEELVTKYPIISIEDPVDENDWEGFSLITSKLGNKIQLVGVIYLLPIKNVYKKDW